MYRFLHLLFNLRYMYIGVKNKQQHQDNTYKQDDDLVAVSFEKHGHKKNYNQMYIGAERIVNLGTDKNLSIEITDMDY
jgi:hypothetical protein